MTSLAAGPGVAVTWRPGRVVAVSPDDAQVWLFGGPGPVRLAGRGSGPLARAVDGVRDLAAVVAAAIADGMPAVDAERFAQRWWASGHLVAAGAPSAERPQVEVADRMHAAPPLAGQVSVRDRLVAALRTARTDVSVTDPTSGAVGPGLRVVLVDDLLEATADDGGAVPTVLVQLRGDRPLVGPLLHRDASCPACLVARLRVRRMPDLVAAEQVGRALPPPHATMHDHVVPAVAGVLAAGARAVAAAACKDGVLDVAALGEHADRVRVVDVDSGQVDSQRLVPVAGCPDCDPGGPVVATSHLDPGDWRTSAGTPDREYFRVVDPERTWDRHCHLVGDVVGVVPYVVPTGPPAVRAFSAGANVAAEGDVVLLRSRLRHAAGGKGISVTAARTGALAEALERHSLRATGREPTVRARMTDLDGALHPNDIQLFSDAQLRRSAHLRALGLPTEEDGRHRVPLPFDVDAVHDWTAVADLRTGGVRYVLSSLVWLAWPGVAPGHPQGCSNGAAAGNTVAEALLQGLMELVERDAVALWWHPRCRRPAVDLAAWADPRVEAALAPQRALGTDAWVLDVTTDLGIPAAVAVATGVGPLPQAPLLGFGAHLDPVMAVVRALTELAQMQAPFASSSLADVESLSGEAERRWLAEVTPQSQPWLAPDGVVDPRESPRLGGLAEAVEDAADRLAAAGIEVLWAECTRPDIGLPVVRTWAPGLRHFWNRYAPGRLYDVPPALGWCTGGYGEDDLNPYGMIL